VSAPLRICLLAYRGAMQCGGQGVYLWFLARELARQGLRVDVVVGPPYPDPLPFAASVERLHDEGFWGRWFLRDRARLLPRPQPLRVFRPLHFYELAASRLGFLPEPFAFSARAFAALARRLRAGERWDLVHDVQCLGWGLLGIRALGLPVVSTVHHPLSVDRRASFARDRTLREALGTAEFYPVGMQARVARRLDRILTSSDASARLIRRDFGVRDERIARVGNGIDTELFRPDPALPRDPATLLCVGRAGDPNKGVRGFVEALARLPAPVRGVLVDADGSEARRWAAELGVGSRLRVTGRLETPALVELYRRATLAVVPSRYEGFGLPAVEAMACGTPVVASAAGALPEVLRAGGGGLLVPRDDPEALAKAIATLLEQPETRRALGARARARVEAAYAWPRVAARTAQVYREVLAGRSAACREVRAGRARTGG
jgi:glycosyltransferase involved in cell wall biosynthesis